MSDDMKALIDEIRKAGVGLSDNVALMAECYSTESCGKCSVTVCQAGGDYDEKAFRELLAALRNAVMK